MFRSLLGKQKQNGEYGMKMMNLIKIQLLTDGNLTPQTTESKKVSVIEEKTSQLCTTPCRGTSQFNEGREKLAAPSSTTNQLQTFNTKFQTPNLRNTDETKTGMCLSKIDCFYNPFRNHFNPIEEKTFLRR